MKLRSYTLFYGYLVTLCVSLKRVYHRNKAYKSFLKLQRYAEHPGRVIIWYAYCIGKKVKFCHLHVLENKNVISYEYGVVGKAAFQNITPHITLFGVNKIRTFLHYLSYLIREWCHPITMQRHASLHILYISTCSALCASLQSFLQYMTCHLLCIKTPFETHAILTS